MNDIPPVVIDRPLYCMAKVILSADSLKNKGMLAGGPTILDRQKLTAIVTAAEALGMPVALTNEEINDVLRSFES